MFLTIILHNNTIVAQEQETLKSQDTAEFAELMNYQIKKIIQVVGRLEVTSFKLMYISNFYIYES